MGHRHVAGPDDIVHIANSVTPDARAALTVCLKTYKLRMTELPVTCLECIAEEGLGANRQR